MCVRGSMGVCVWGGGGEEKGQAYKLHAWISTTSKYLKCGDMYTLQNMHVFTAWIMIFICCLPEGNHLKRGGAGGKESGVPDDLPLDL